jgi:hypothetical protein
MLLKLTHNLGQPCELYLLARPDRDGPPAAGRRRLSMGKRGLVTLLHSERWTKEAAEGVQFTVGNGINN